MNEKIYCPKCSAEGEYIDTHREPDAEWDIFSCTNSECGHIFTQYEGLDSPEESNDAQGD